MSKLVIPGLQPKDNLKFILTGDIYGTTPQSSVFEVRVPQACPLINKVEIKLEVLSAAPEYTANGSKQFNFEGFKKVTSNRSGTYIFRVRLGEARQRGSLKKGDKARIFTGTTTGISALNNQVFEIVASGESATGRSWVVDFLVPNSFSITVTSGLTTGSAYIREQTVKYERKSFKISIPKAPVFDQLVNAKSPISGTAVNIVRDIPIYAFKNYDVENTNLVKRYLLLDGNKLLDGNPGDPTEINEKTPPTYSTELRDAYLQGPSYTKILRVDEKPNFIFYVAIARYIYKNNAWTGQWLQKNQDNNAIWGKAVKNSGG